MSVLCFQPVPPESSSPENHATGLTPLLSRKEPRYRFSLIVVSWPATPAVNHHCMLLLLTLWPVLHRVVTVATSYSHQTASHFILPRVQLDVNMHHWFKICSMYWCIFIEGCPELFSRVFICRYESSTEGSSLICKCVCACVIGWNCMQHPPPYILLTNTKS